MSPVKPTQVQRLVLQPAGQEVACGRRLLRQRKAAHLPPIDLEVFGRQPLEAERDIPGSLQLRPLPPDPAHQIVKDGAPTPVRLRRVGARAFEDSNVRQPVADPVFDLPSIGFDVRMTSTLGRLLRDRLVQHAGNRRPTPSQVLGDLPLTLAPFRHHLNDTALHLPQHPFPPSCDGVLQ
jgi:hypothetical protein